MENNVETSCSLDTIKFKTVIPDYPTFINSQVAIDTIQNFTVWGKNGEIIPIETWGNNIFRLLFRRYKNWEINYDNVDDFLDALWERLEIQIPNYYMRKIRYEQLLSLTDNELLSTGRYISNFVDHSDETVEDPLNSILKNLTSQNSSQNFGDFSGRIRQQIYNAQMNLINDFLKFFNNLFVRFSQSSQI